MNVEIISHDDTTGKARIKFSHNDVVHEADYDLTLVVPGMQKTLTDLGQTYTREMQLKALDKLIESIQFGIESGGIQNRIE
jgi:hypothetical protein